MTIGYSLMIILLVYRRAKILKTTVVMTSMNMAQTICDKLVRFTLEQHDGYICIHKSISVCIYSRAQKVKFLSLY